jgi:hypothetical protein
MELLLAVAALATIVSALLAIIEFVLERRRRMREDVRKPRHLRK